MPRVSFVVTDDDDLITALKWAKKNFPTAPLAAIHKLFRKKDIRREKKALTPTDALHSGESLSVFVPENFSEKKTTKVSRINIPNGLSLPVLFEDEHLAVVNKVAGISVHSGSGEPFGIIDIAQKQFDNSNIRLCHRLDRYTSGALLLAKNGGTLRRLLEELQKKNWKKEYVALIFGCPSQKVGTINIPLERQEFGKKMVAGSGKRAITHYKVVEIFSETTLVFATLETGRTHQIRAHFSAIGHPLVGDHQHGHFAKNRAFQKKYDLCYPFLHAKKLGFIHPVTGENVIVKADLPKKLNTIVKAIRGK